jgi:hypothetical protein
VAGFFLIPATGIATIIYTFDLPDNVKLITLIGMILIWSGMLAWICVRYTAMLLGEDEPGGLPFDWVAWRIRFYIGFAIGFLLGWRMARYSDTFTIIGMMMIVGAIGGFVFGAYRENFWRRPL